jgi:hypothetical protein
MEVPLRYLLLFALFLTQPPTAPPVKDIPPTVPPVKYSWGSPVEMPVGAVTYTTGVGQTQRIAVTDGRDTIWPMWPDDEKWLYSGGLHETWGWKSTKYKTIPKGGTIYVGIGDIQVLNSFNVYQPNRGLLRWYPVGMRFDDILSNAKGKVFEHRMTMKTANGWVAKTLFKDEKERPPGYKGLSVSCSSCHDQAGSGAYAGPLVPGGDFVFSDPLPWFLAQ